MAELCREHGMMPLPGRGLRCNRREGMRRFTSMDVSPIARFSLSCSAIRSQVANISPASPVDGAPKREFRAVSLNKWSASAGHYKCQLPHTPEFAGRFISLIVLQSMLRAQSGARNSLFLFSMAQMIRAFLLATATMARFMPRRSRRLLTH